MVCLNPKPVWYEWYNHVNEKTGEIYRTKRARFIAPDKDVGIETEWIPCGKCEGCRIDKANDWATRCYLESQNHALNAFVTLTYDDDHIPAKKSLLKADLQKFWKRLRKSLPYKISYLAAGEYGNTTGRPHYHAAIFGYWPEDAEPFQKNKIGDTLYTSKTLEKIWGNGYILVGNLTYASAAYIARYVYKKAFGADKLPTTNGQAPEFITSSKRPAIAKNFYFEPEKWAKIIRNNGILVPNRNGLQIKAIPAYLRNKWKEDNRNEYYQWQKDQRQAQVENQKEILSGTKKNFGWYRRQTNETKVEQLKRLDKARNKI